MAAIYFFLLICVCSQLPTYLAHEDPQIHRAGVARYNSNDFWPIPLAGKGHRFTHSQASLSKNEKLHGQNENYKTMLSTLKNIRKRLKKIENSLKKKLHTKVAYSYYSIEDSYEGLL
ncbi:uncharacterized protein LOC142985487 isoform X1 [Anticarsia gemmatalis]|uniref:uncharacterized protein LOC142985487 isoform X1 n=1 Tax=Anticarsia gemmatalis TaxID=129554 RepID=UPI003F775C94